MRPDVREWLAAPQILSHRPGAHEAQVACEYDAPTNKTVARG